jgi:ribonuclease I
MSMRPRFALPFLIALSAGLATSAAPAGWHDKPGAFDYYALVLGWAPSYCRSEGRFRHDGECGTSKPRAFVLHGLWPQYAKGWPEDCPTGRRPWVPSHVIDEMRDLMPSKSLIIHEYRTHGTCSGLEPAQYFGVARELYEREQDRGAPGHAVRQRPRAGSGGPNPRSDRWPSRESYWRRDRRSRSRPDSSPSPN